MQKNCINLPANSFVNRVVGSVLMHCLEVQQTELLTSRCFLSPLSLSCDGLFLLTCVPLPHHPPASCHPCLGSNNHSFIPVN